MKKYALMLAMVCTVCANTYGNTDLADADSTLSVALDEIEIVSSPKETGTMRQQPASVTLIGKDELDKHHITSLKGISVLAPNFFMPDYGSRLTSAVYIRGVGSRINTPAVGLYVDNIPYTDKSAFDFNFYDIERIDVLRGPQSTLYGRNTMGGLVRVYTKSPLSYQGTDVRLGYATGDNHRTISLTHYHRPSNNFAFAAGGYYEGSNGFFKNDATGHEVDALQAGGGRLRALYLATKQLKFDATINFDYSDEGAYPYYYNGTVEGTETYADAIGKITANHEGRYRRALFNAGLNTEYVANGFVLNSITGYQMLNDRAQFDQDFMSPDFYFMLQKQKSSVVSEEITIKKRPSAEGISSSSEGNKDDFNWLFGLNASYQWLTTEAPVTFYEDGIASLIEGNVNKIFTSLKETYPKMPNMALNVTDNQFTNESRMKTPLLNLALFHQSTFTLGNWEITAGLRLDYEKMRLDYHSESPLNYEFQLTMPPYMNKVYDNLKAQTQMEGVQDDEYLQLLPRLSFKYSFGRKASSEFVYATVNRGYRSGGYNIQMFSDLAQSKMRGEMMTEINEVSNKMMEKYVDMESINKPVDINSIVYRPEYSWNFEVGSHVGFGIFDVQAALFYSNIHDQQISHFVSSGLGRTMVNAGKSESFGLEASLAIDKYLRVSYGYTQAKFVEYDDGTTDFSGNYVPFVPQHTLNVGAELPFDIKGTMPLRVTVGADLSAAGRIYWTEANNAHQDFYATLGAHIGFDFKHIGINIWGKNLTDKDFDTFYFESMKRSFTQHGKPFQVGVDVKLNF